MPNGRSPTHRRYIIKSVNAVRRHEILVKLLSTAVFCVVTPSSSEKAELCLPPLSY
jgi:hypothetical protein